MGGGGEGGGAVGQAYQQNLKEYQQLTLALHKNRKCYILRNHRFKTSRNVGERKRVEYGCAKRASPTHP